MPKGPSIQCWCYHHISRTTSLLHQNYSSESLLAHVSECRPRTFVVSICSSDSSATSLLPLAVVSADTLLEPFCFPSFGFLSADTLLDRGSAVAWWLMPRTSDPEVGGSSPTRVKPCCVLEQGAFTPESPEVGGSSPTRVKPCCVLEQGAFTPQKY